MQATNTGFICQVCGKTDLIPSLAILQANYGSSYDGETILLHVCGDCVDEIIETINRRTRKKLY